MQGQIDRKELVIHSIKESNKHLQCKADKSTNCGTEFGISKASNFKSYKKLMIPAL